VLDLQQRHNLRSAVGRVRAALEMDRSHQQRRATDIEACNHRHARADAAFVGRLLAGKPARAVIEPYDSRSIERRLAEDGVAMQAERVALVHVPDLLAVIAKPELDILDAEGVAGAEQLRQLAYRMAVARPRHADIQLGQQHDVRPDPVQQCRTLRQLLAAVAERLRPRRRDQLDGLQAGQAGSQPIMLGAARRHAPCLCQQMRRRLRQSRDGAFNDAHGQSWTAGPQPSFLRGYFCRT
jgi:hypothetical protein